MYLIGNVNNEEEINIEDLILIRSLLRLNILYVFWIEADKFVDIFSLYGRERDKYTESGTAGQIVRKRDCPAESGTVGMYEYIVFLKYFLIIL